MTRPENLDWFLFQIKPARFSHISREYLSSFVSFSQYVSSSTPRFPPTKTRSRIVYPPAPEPEPNSHPARPLTSPTSFFASVDQPPHGAIVACTAPSGGSRTLHEGLFGLSKRSKATSPIKTSRLSRCHLQSGPGLNILAQDQRSGLQGS